MATAVATLLLGRFLIRIMVKSSLRSLTTVVVFELAAVMRAFVLSQLLVEFHLIHTNEFFWRLYGSQANVFFPAIITSALVSMAREYSEKNQELADSLATLVSTKDELAERTAHRKDSLLRSVREQLNNGMALLTGNNLNNDAYQLKSLIDEVVRPISHRLGREFLTEDATTVSTFSVKIRWARIWAAALEENPIHPLWFTLWTAPVALQWFVIFAGQRFLAPYLSALAFFILWFAAARFLWNYLPTKLGLTARGVAYTLSTFAMAFTMNWFVQIVFRLGLNDAGFVIGEALWIGMITWTISLVVALRNTLRSTNEKLTTANEELKRRLIVENVSARHLEEGISRVLHGPVQDAIAASLKRIQAMPPGTQLGETEITAIRQPIEEALKKLDQKDPHQISAEQGIGDLAALWAGVVEIEVVWGDEVLNCLRNAATTSSIVIELVRESVSNAIRHGDAQHIWIEANLNDSRNDVVISVSNDGLQVSHNALPGIGTSLLTSMSLSWSRVNTEVGVTLTATIPLQANSFIS
ncbi:hypothetical protein [Aurantimicrobium minutum]|uniref:hypothetical protein n=1 Tax=Aurantimicrobium minutum TaxID=708131 RepID=UPI0024771DA2|nr:hypothetical protein [Aurantimicrobium minutum]